MKMVMSADSSDCHISSESASTRLLLSPPEHLTSSFRDKSECQLILNTENEYERTSNIPLSLLGNSQQNSKSQSHHHSFRLHEIQSIGPQTSPESSSTPISQGIVGSSHLENVLNLPLNTSASTYYQQRKISPSSADDASLGSPLESHGNFIQHSDNTVINNLEGTQPFSSKISYIKPSLSLIPNEKNTANNITLNTGITSNTKYRSTLSTTDLKNGRFSPPFFTSSHSSSSPESACQNPHNNIAFINKTTCNINKNTLVVQHSHSNQQSNVHESYKPPNNINFNNYVASTTDLTSSTVLVNNYTQNSSYLNHNEDMYQLSGTKNASVAAIDSRPQTPEYIKSYPVMETTVACSVKGEPELNIGKYATYLNLAGLTKSSFNLIVNRKFIYLKLILRKMVL